LAAAVVVAAVVAAAVDVSVCNALDKMGFT